MTATEPPDRGAPEERGGDGAPHPSPPPAAEEPTAQPPAWEPTASAETDPERGAGAPPRRRLRRRILWTLGALAAVPLVVAAFWWVTWPDVAALASANPESTAFIDDAAQRGDVVWTWVPDRRIPPWMRKAVVVAEDISFFSHDGFDTHELGIAIRNALDGKRLRGASTITQQLAKNLWLSPSRNPLRKVREALLARSLERHLSKRRILEIYLNVVEFGPGVYGVEAAARRYFGKPAAQLTPGEAARLAASLPSSRWHPGADSRGYRAHVERVQARMRQTGWLDGLVR